MMPTRPAESADGQRLAQLFQTLPPAERATLLAFADFLAQRSAPPDSDAETLPRPPQPLVRPEIESVVGAIKRLSQTYDMLDRSLLLHETSALMSAHVLRGQTAVSVIDELEALFSLHYQSYCAKFS